MANSGQYTTSKSPTTIKAQGDILAKIGGILICGIVAVILASGGVYISCAKPDHAKDYWVIVGPILTICVTAFIDKRSR